MQQYRNLIAAAALAVGLAGPAAAQAVRPIQDQNVALGRVAGDVYYTVKPDGYHVVATFAELDEAATPVRFETVLAPGQSVTVSTPHAAGTAPEAVEISRQNDLVFVRKAAVTN